MQVSLELNSLHISQAIKGYIAHKVEELSSASGSGYVESLREEIKTQLFTKAEETFLWVSLVCKQLEHISPEDALQAIQSLPPGLHAFFDQAFTRLHQGNQEDDHKCMRLMQVMMLVYRPLNIAEVSILADLNESSDKIKVIVDRCASFLIRIGNNIEFVHQSTRDYLAEDSTQSILRIYSNFGHLELLARCLLHLSIRLKVNLLGLPRPDSTRNLANIPGEKQDVILTDLDYAATFWVRHLANIDQVNSEKSRIFEDVGAFLNSKLLELFECLSLLGKTPFAIQSMEELSSLTKDDHSISALAKDAKRVLLRHSHTIDHWPLQIYSSAIIFSPELSVVKKQNLHKVPKYFRHFTGSTDENWSSLIQTLQGHLSTVMSVAFFDGKRIASGSEDKTVKIWDSSTGALEKTLESHSDAVKSVAFSPDGQRVISGSKDKTIKIWNLTGALEKTLKGHSAKVNSVAFSPDGKWIASGSKDHTVKLWNAKGLLERTLKGHSNQVRAVAFLPDGKRLVSGSFDKTVKLWYSENGALHKTLRGHLSEVSTVAVSPDGKHIVSGSLGASFPMSRPMKVLARLRARDEREIILWDSSGNCEKAWHFWEGVYTVAFSPDSKHFASGSLANNVRIGSIAEDPDSLEHKSNETEVPGLTRALSYSPNGMRLASSFQRLVTIWDTASFLGKIYGDRVFEATPLVFSPNGKKVAFYFGDGSVFIRHLLTYDLQMVFKSGPASYRSLAFSPTGNSSHSFLII